MSAGKKHQLIEKGSAAPPFRLPRLDGGEATLADLSANGPVVLAFFKISCPVCQLTFPYLERIHAAGKIPVYGISQNDAADTREFNHRYELTLPTLLDSEESGFPISNAFGISTVPTIFVVERDGKVERVFEGWRKHEMAQLGSEVGIDPFAAGGAMPEFRPG